MKVAVYGSWNDPQSPRKSFACPSSLSDFASAGRKIGAMLAQLHHKIVITSFTKHTLDGYVVRGYLEQWKPLGTTPVEPPITLIKYDAPQQDGEGEETEQEFERVMAENSLAATYETAEGLLRFDRHLAGLKRVSLALTMGGADHTLMAGEVALVAGIPLVPIGSFGGASAGLLRKAQGETKNPLRRSLLGKLNAGWGDATLHAVRELMSKRSIAIIYGHATDFTAVRDLVVGFPNGGTSFEPLVLGEQVQGAEALAVTWEYIAGEADAAIAVVTPDDLGGVAGGAQAPRARQNVWLEVGWAWARLGLKKMLLLVRGNVEIPSDLGNSMHYRYEENPTEKGEEIRAFLRSIA